MTAFTLQLQNWVGWVITTETIWPQSLKYLQSGPLQKNFANPWYSISTYMYNHITSGSPPWLYKRVKSPWCDSSSQWDGVSTLHPVSPSEHNKNPGPKMHGELSKDSSRQVRELTVTSSWWWVSPWFYFWYGLQDSPKPGTAQQVQRSLLCVVWGAGNGADRTENRGVPTGLFSSFPH